MTRPKKKKWAREGNYSFTVEDLQDVMVAISKHSHASIREIVRELPFGKTKAFHAIRVLIKAGYINRGPVGSARSVTVNIPVVDMNRVK